MVAIVKRIKSVVSGIAKLTIMEFISLFALGLCTAAGFNFYPSFTIVAMLILLAMLLVYRFIF